MQKGVFSAVWVLMCLVGHSQSMQALKKDFHAMGSAFEITAVSMDFSLCKRAIELGEKEVQRIEKLISSWDPNSQTSMINRAAGHHAVAVDKELYDLIRRSVKISRLTNGAFDISFASMDKIWTFDRKSYERPADSTVLASVERVGFQNIILDEKNHSVFLKKEGMKIGFGGIGKGYAAMKVTALMRDLGVLGGIVNCGGDLYAWGESDHEEGWTVAIADPKKDRDFVAYLQLNNQSIVTSGDYERYLFMDGQRYGHIIDPKTGWPSQGLKSVSIICGDAELADALATSVFVMGKEDGLYFINQLNGVECLLIDDHDEMHASDGLNLLYKEQKTQ